MVQVSARSKGTPDAIECALSYIKGTKGTLYVYIPREHVKDFKSTYTYIYIYIYIHVHVHMYLFLKKMEDFLAAEMQCKCR